MSKKTAIFVGGYFLYIKTISKYNMNNMNRRAEILSDRKLLNSLLEKYGKDDVIQFLDTNFNDEETYFDTFTKEDQKIKNNLTIPRGGINKAKLL